MPEAEHPTKLPISLEGAIGLLLAIVAMIGDIDWWLRGLLDVCALGLVIHVGTRLAVNVLWRAMFIVGGTILLAIVTWRPIWTGFSPHWPWVAGAIIAFTSATIVRAAFFTAVGVILAKVARAGSEWWKTDPIPDRNLILFNLGHFVLGIFLLFFFPYFVYTAWEQTKDENSRLADVAHTLNADDIRPESLQAAAHRDAANRQAILRALQQLCARQTTPPPTECRLAPKPPKSPAKR